MKTDIIDILKVNGATLGAIGVTQSKIIEVAEAVQAVGMAVLILVAVAYNIVKLLKINQEKQWAKQDREQE